MAGLLDFIRIPAFYQGPPGSSALQGQATTNLDHVVGDHAESHPAFYAAEPAIPGATESVATLEYADASLTSGPPPLARAEPTLLLKSPERFAAEIFQMSNKPSRLFDVARSV
jgi:hypothetical protein